MHQEMVMCKSVMKELENTGKRKLSDSEENESDSDPQNYEGSLGRPRKKVYKSTLRKRNREKRRRDQFNDGLQQLADIVFSIDPSVASGRDSMGTSDSGPSTSVTNRGELMQTAVDGMKRLVREHTQQQKEIADLRQALASEQVRCRLLSSSSNPRFPGMLAIEQQQLQPVSSNTPVAKNLNTEGVTSLTNGSLDLLALARLAPNSLFAFTGNDNALHSAQRQQQPQGRMHSADSVLGGIPSGLLSLHRNDLPINADIITQSLLTRGKG